MSKEVLEALERVEAASDAIDKAVLTALDNVFGVASLSSLETSAKSLELNEYALRQFPFSFEWRVTDGFGSVIAGRSENARWLAKDMMRIVMGARERCLPGEDPRIFVDLMAYDGEDFSRNVEEKWSIRKVWDEVLDAGSLLALETSALSLMAHELACERLSAPIEWRFMDGAGGKFSGKCDGARGFANDLLRICAAARRRFPRGSNPPVAVELLSYDGEAMTSKDDCRV
jgi:hypothetical protein